MKVTKGDIIFAHFRSAPKNFWWAFVIAAILFWGATKDSSAVILDRVVAFVDNEAITLSEFREQNQKTREITPDVSENDVLNTMINRLLLLKEARKYRIEAANEEDVIREYVDLKVRAFIAVSEADMDAFYRKNLNQFAGKEYEEVRDEIEQYLVEKAVNERLKGLLRGLRKNAYVKLQLESGKPAVTD